jgi:hypothetical protein
LDAKDWMTGQNSLITARNYDVKQPNFTPTTPRGAGEKAYHSETRLKDGRLSMLVDIGSVGNLSGDQWVKAAATAALAHKRSPEQYKRDRPLSVSGVGSGAQVCTHNVKLPIAIPCKDGSIIKGTFDTPVVPNSPLPALLGLDSTRRMRGIIDTNDLCLYLLGPGDYDLKAAMPDGTETIQCELAPSGHIVVPCDSFAKLDEREKLGGLKLEHEVALPVTSMADTRPASSSFQSGSRAEPAVSPR